MKKKRHCHNYYPAEKEGKSQRDISIKPSRTVRGKGGGHRRRGVDDLQSKKKETGRRPGFRNNVRRREQGI